MHDTKPATQSNSDRAAALALAANRRYLTALRPGCDSRYAVRILRQAIRQNARAVALVSAT